MSQRICFTPTVLHRIFYRLFWLPDLRGKVSKDNAIQVIDLMLKDARQPSINLELHRLAAAIETLNTDFIRPFHLADQHRDRQAAFYAYNRFR